MNKVQLSSLTTKEVYILALWGCSLTVKESARLLDLSDRSINYYRGRLKCMFNVRTAHELIRTIILMDEYESLIKLGKKFLTDDIDENEPPFSFQDCA